MANFCCSVVIDSWDDRGGQQPELGRNVFQQKDKHKQRDRFCEGGVEGMLGWGMARRRGGGESLIS